MSGRSNLNISSKGPYLLIWPLDCAENFTGVSIGCFPWVSNKIATRWRGGLLGQPLVSAQKGHNFWSDHWITLKFLQGFPEAVFLGVAMELLLGDKEVWSAILDYRLKRGITFDPIVGLRSNFYRGFKRLFSLVPLCNHYSVTGISDRPALSIGSKGQ
jgi:hypothetical protein